MPERVQLSRAKGWRMPMVRGDVAIIPLTRGMEAVIDVVDLPLVADHQWFADRVRDTDLYYAARMTVADGTRRIARMHNVITSGGPVDHRDGDGLNNRRANLRPYAGGSNQANARRPISNTSGYKGVVRTRNGRPWAAQIHVDREHIYLGRFDDPESAARAYDAAALQHFGEFARLNFSIHPEKGATHDQDR